MPQENPFIVEMTGIFRAGFLPGLLDSVASALRNHYLCVDSNGHARKMRTSHHVDNTLRLNHDPRERDRIQDLVTSGSTFSDSEFTGLIESLRKADELCKKSIQSRARELRGPIDITFRRGGSLHESILLGGTRWEEARIHRTLPARMQIVLNAQPDAIEQTFDLNEQALGIYKKNPEAYYPTWKEAFDKQEEWRRKLEQAWGFGDHNTITRQRATNEDLAKEEFATVIVEQLIEPLRTAGFDTMQRRRVFISYCHEDSDFAEKLEVALRQRAIGVWVDNKEILVGDNIPEAITEGIDSCNFICALLSNASVQSDWARRFEWRIAITRQMEGKRVGVLPLVLNHDCQVPTIFSGIQNMDFSKTDFEAGVEKLIRRLRRDF